MKLERRTTILYPYFMTFFHFFISCFKKLLADAILDYFVIIFNFSHRYHCPFSVPNSLFPNSKDWSDMWAIFTCNLFFAKSIMSQFHLRETSIGDQVTSQKLIKQIWKYFSDFEHKSVTFLIGRHAMFDCKLPIKLKLPKLWHKLQLIHSHHSKYQ